MAFWSLSVSVVVVPTASVTVPSICSVVASARAIERNRAASDGVTDQLDGAAVIRLDGGAAVADVALDLQRRPALRLQRGARLVGDDIRPGGEHQLVGKAGSGSDVAKIVQRQIDTAGTGGAVADGAGAADIASD